MDPVSRVKVIAYANTIRLAIVNTIKAAKILISMKFANKVSVNKIPAIKDTQKTAESLTVVQAVGSKTDVPTNISTVLHQLTKVLYTKLLQKLL